MRFSMFGTIVAKELRETTRDRRLLAGLSLLPILLVAALALGRFDADALSARHRRASLDARENWLSQTSSDPHGAAHHGTYLFKPKSSLGFFDPGLDPVLGTTLRLEAHRQHQLSNRPAPDASDLGRLDTATAARLLQVVMPLTIILLGFSGFTRERDGGTLPMLLALGIPRGRLIAAKAVAILIAVACLTAPATLAMAAMGLLGFVAKDGGDLILRVSTLAFAYATYAAAWTLFSLAVSAFSRTSRTSLIVLIALWSTTVFVIPRVAMIVAKQANPLPSREEIDRRDEFAARYGENGKPSIRGRYEGLKKDLLDRYEVERVEDLPMNFEGVYLQSSEDFANDSHDESKRKHSRRFSRRRIASSIVSCPLPPRSRSEGPRRRWPGPTAGITTDSRRKPNRIVALS